MPDPIDDPQTDHEAVQLLQASLRSVADRLEMLLDNGFPRAGRSADDLERYRQWHEDIGEAVGKARIALAKTSTFSDSQNVQP